MMSETPESASQVQPIPPRIRVDLRCWKQVALGFALGWIVLPILHFLSFTLLGDALYFLGGGWRLAEFLVYFIAAALLLGVMLYSRDYRYWSCVLGGLALHSLFLVNAWYWIALGRVDTAGVLVIPMGVMAGPCTAPAVFEGAVLSRIKYEEAGFETFGFRRADDGRRYSIGPMREDNQLEITYDPTNGTVSPGDIPLDW